MTIIDRRYSVAEGTAVKAPCRAATTANIALTGLQTIDGVVLAEHDRVLVKNQTDATTNGIYAASTGNWTRERDFDGAYDIVDGTRIFVTSGSANGGTEYTVTSADPIVIGTTSLTFASIAATAVASAAAAASSATAASSSASAASSSASAAATSAALAVASAVTPFSAGMLNGTIVASVAASALTISIKTLAGITPTALDSVKFSFRNVTPATGDYAVRTVSAGLSLVISSGSTMGFSSATPGRLWLIAIDNGGTVELAAINCLSGKNIYPLGGWGIISTTAEGGAGGADSAQVAYSTSARTSKPYLVLGYLTWESGGTLTAGTWSATPTRVQIYGPGVPLPGATLQLVSANSTTVGSATSGTFVALTSGTTVAISLTSSANLVKVESAGTIAGDGNAGFFVQLSRGTMAATNLFGNIAHQNVGGDILPASMWGFDLPATASSTTYAIQGKATSGTVSYPGSGDSMVIAATEIMA